MISKGANDWNRGFYNACKEGHIDIVKLMISKGANDWNWGLSYACKGGNIDIVNLLISKGATYWNRGLSYACKGGNINIVNLMILYGANEYNDISEEQFIQLLHLGLPINKLQLHPLYNQYNNKINEHKKETFNTLQYYIIKPIINIINDYQLF
jgi:ankyrin repeat protein